MAHYLFNQVFQKDNINVPNFKIEHPCIPLLLNLMAYSSSGTHPSGISSLKNEHNILTFSFPEFTNCIAEDEIYTGNLSVSATGRSCVPWQDISTQDDTLNISLSHFPDGSWDELLNKCRSIDFI